MTCRHCGRTIPLLRRLSDVEFCSPDHRRLFTEMQQHLAFARLLEAQQRLSALPKVPLTPRQAPPPLLDTLVEAPRLAGTVSLWPAMQSPSQVSLRAAGPEWPIHGLVLPFAALSLTGDWMKLAEEQDEQELFVDPKVWARLAALPPIEPYFGEFLEPVAESAAMPAVALQLIALSRAIQRTSLAITGHVESLPGFLELYLSFLRVAEVDPPEYRPIEPEALPLVPPTLSSRPLYNFQSIAPSPAVEEPVAEEVPVVEEPAAEEPEEIVSVELAAVERELELAPEEVKLVALETAPVEPELDAELVAEAEPEVEEAVAEVETAPAPVEEEVEVEAPVEIVASAPVSAPDTDRLRLEFAQPTRRPVFASFSAEPLLVRYDSRPAAVPMPRPAADPLEFDLSLAGASAAVEPPALTDSQPWRQTPAPQSLAVPVPASTHGGSQHRLMTHLEWASLTPFAPLEIVSLSPHEPTGDERHSDIPFQHLYPAVERSAPSRGESHRTELVPLAFALLNQGSVVDPGAHPVEAASSPAAVSPELGSDTPVLFEHELVPTGLAAAPDDYYPPLDAELEPHALEPAAVSVPADNCLPPWRPDLGCGLLLAHAVSMPVRILARQNKV